MNLAESIITGEPLGARVVKAVPQNDFTVLLTFTTGERRLFDAKPLLGMPAFKPLANKAFFETVKVDFGTVVWANDIDYCPDTLYIESVPIQ